MRLTSAEAKRHVMQPFQRAESDTGSPEVQIAVLTHRISYLTTHLKANKKDNHSRRGLLALVSRRRKLLDYIKRKDANAYLKLLADLGLRK